MVNLVAASVQADPVEGVASAVLVSEEAGAGPASLSLRLREAEIAFIAAFPA